MIYKKHSIRVSASLINPKNSQISSAKSQEHTLVAMIKNLSSDGAAIGYLPLKNEPNPEVCLPKLSPSIHFTIPTDQSVDPIETGNQVAKLFSDVRVCLYIPGTAFDRHGVRHGRGSGWYDCFLSRIPPQWIRIGFCFENQFSHSSLKRKAWDELMDWVCVRGINKTDYYETRARISP